MYWGKVGDIVTSGRKKERKRKEKESFEGGHCWEWVYGGAIFQAAAVVVGSCRDCVD